MSGLIPRRVIDVVRTFNNIGVSLYGIDCTLYVPTNLTTLEPEDIYTSPDDITYRMHGQIKVWIEWFVPKLHRLRKLGVFAEAETPIIARFQNIPEVITQSYIKIKSEYIPGKFDTDEFEIVDVLMQNMYNTEVFRYYKLAPRRAKNT
jgi:hypothetical protein